MYHTERPYSVKLLIGLLGGFIIGALVTSLCFWGAWYVSRRLHYMYM